VSKPKIKFNFFNRPYEDKSNSICKSEETVSGLVGIGAERGAHIGIGAAAHGALVEAVSHMSERIMRRKLTD